MGISWSGASGADGTWSGALRSTAWDVRSARVTFLLAVILFAVACVITAATDEGAVGWTTRIERTLPVLPVCGGAAALIVLRRASARGEMLAFATLGSSPARACAYVVAAASGVSLIGALAIAAYGPAADTFFPRPPSASPIRIDGATFVDDERGVRITGAGDMSAASSDAVHRAPLARGRSASAAIVVAAFGVAFAVGAARLTSAALGAMLAATSSCVFLLQVAATGHVPALLACLPAVLLLIAALVRYRSPAW